MPEIIVSIPWPFCSSSLQIRNVSPPSSVLLNATQLLRFYYHPETAKNPIEFLQKIVTFNRNIKIWPPIIKSSYYNSIDLEWTMMERPTRLEKAALNAWNEAVV